MGPRENRSGAASNGTRLARPGRRRTALLAILGCAALTGLVTAIALSRSDGSGLPQNESTVATGASPQAASQAAAGDLRQVSGAGPGPRLEAAAEPAQPAAGDLAGRVICIDPGHAATADAGVEPIGPGSAEMKVKDPGGTSGIVTGVREPVVTLAVSLYLREILESRGATVVMTRSGPDYSGGNRERAQVANEAGADLLVRIHADGSADPSRRGVSTLYPAPIPGWTDDIHTQSRAAAQAVQAAMVSGLGAADLGIVERSDITGFNWADVPAILVEVGFMSNAEEDVMLSDAAYQQRVAMALSQGIGSFLS